MKAKVFASGEANSRDTTTRTLKQPELQKRMKMEYCHLPPGIHSRAANPMGGKDQTTVQGRSQKRKRKSE